jgi:hypothetical protein
MLTFSIPIVFSITAMRWIHRYCHRADSAQDQTDPAVQGVGVYPMSVIATARTSCLQMGMQSGALWHPSIRTIAGGTGDIQSQIRKRGQVQRPLSKPEPHNTARVDRAEVTWL